MAHPTRLAILRELSRGPKCVTDIRDLVDVTQANTSQHLAALRNRNIVDYHEDGNLRCYYISRPAIVTKLFDLLSSEEAPVWQSPDEVRSGAQRRCETARG